MMRLIEVLTGLFVIWFCLRENWRAVDWLTRWM